MKTRMKIVMLTVALGSVIFAGVASAAPILPFWGVQEFVNHAPDNAYFTMTDSKTRTFVGEFEDDGETLTESFELTNTGPGRVLLGVQTWTQHDDAFEGDLLVESTDDYYAQDTDGNVWYFGEDVTNFEYDDMGNLTGTNSSSSWLAGVNDALPGIIMPADPFVGFSYFQEYAPNDEALDHGTIHAIGGTITLDVGTFADVVQILEGALTEPDAREFKYYAPGEGLILVLEGLDLNLLNPELSVELVSAVPVPAALPLLSSALVGMGVVARRRRSQKAEQ